MGPMASLYVLCGKFTTMGWWKEEEYVISSSSGVEEPTTHLDDWCFCRTNLFGYNNKKNKANIFPLPCHLNSIQSKILHHHVTCGESSTDSYDDAKGGTSCPDDDDDYRPGEHQLLKSINQVKVNDLVGDFSLSERIR